LQKKQARQCRRLPPLNASYELGPVLGEGYQSQVSIVTDRATGESLVARFDCKRPLLAAAQATTGVVPKRRLLGVGTDRNLAVGKLTQRGPHMMQLRDVVCQDRQVVPVFTRCAGKPLEALFPADSCPKVSLAEFRAITKQLIEAVGYMAQNGFWHRDLMSPNILWDADTQKLCIIDFGHAEQFPKSWGPLEAMASTKARRRVEKFVYAKISRLWSGLGNLKAPREDTWAVASITAMLLSVPAPLNATPHARGMKGKRWQHGDYVVSSVVLVLC
jgi:serine/threonine protein kinase